MSTTHAVTRTHRLAQGDGEGDRATALTDAHRIAAQGKGHVLVNLGDVGAGRRGRDTRGAVGIGRIGELQRQRLGALDGRVVLGGQPEAEGGADEGVVEGQRVAQPCHAHR